MSFEIIKKFEDEVANFFGAPYAVAVDCCTHGLELCLRKNNIKKISVPKRTYISVPLLSKKLNINLEWREEQWNDYYYLTENIIDAAVLWKEKSYIPNTYMCISFQYRKHLSLGRGGIILFDKQEDYECLKKMSYDGRSPDSLWMEQNIKTIGYHYYMTPETASLGIKKLPNAIATQSKSWTINDWPDVSKMDVFNDLDD